MMPDKGHEAADKELKRLEKAISKHYAQAAKELTKKAEAFMRDFERKDAQMKKLVEAGKMAEEDYRNWRRNQMMTEERIQDMKDTLAKDLTNADQIAAGMINDTLPSAYAENFNFGTYEIETGSTVDTSFTLYDKKTVENLMKKDPKIIPKARVDIPKDELWNRQKLTSAIIQGILQGESVPEIANRLQTVADMDRNAAIRNARTYTTAAENKGRVDSIERANEMGIPADQEWIATLDDRTRMEHRHLDGQVRPVGEYFETDGYRILYPGDPRGEPEMIYNCRCTLVSRVRGRIYNDERNDSKLDGMSYEEWKHAKDRQMEPPKEEEKQEGEPIKINSEDWTNWATDPEPYQQALNGEEISDYLGGEKLTEEEKERISEVAEEIQNRAENEVVPYDTLFRGESYSSLEEAMEKYKEGSVIINDKLTSYATTSEIAKEYAESGGGIKVIITNTNTQDDVPGSVGVMTDPLGAGGSSEVITAKGMESKVFSSYYDEEEKTLYVGMTNDAEPKSEAGKEETQEEKPAAIKTIGNTGMTFNEVYGDRPTVEKQIKGVSKKGDARSEWLQDTLEIDEDDAEIYLEAVEQYTKGDYTIVHNGDPKAEETIEALDEMLHDKFMPVYDGTIYRGVHVDDSDDLTATEKLNAIISGGTWNEPGITSFSSRKDKAEQFATGADSGESGMCVLIICKDNKSGCPIQHLTDQRPEAEVLVPSDIKDRGYKIINSKITEKKQTIERWHWDPIEKKTVDDEPRIIKRQWAIIEVEENE